MHLRCTQCLILLHLIQTCLRVFVGPGFVSTYPAFMRSSTSHPAGPHDWLAQNGNRAPIAGAAGVDTIAQGLPDHCDSSTACRLCRLGLSLSTRVFNVFN